MSVSWRCTANSWPVAAVLSWKPWHTKKCVTPRHGEKAAVAGLLTKAWLHSIGQVSSGTGAVIHRDYRGPDVQSKADVNILYVSCKSLLSRGPGRVLQAKHFGRNAFPLSQQSSGHRPPSWDRPTAMVLWAGR